MQLECDAFGLYKILWNCLEIIFLCCINQTLTTYIYFSVSVPQPQCCVLCFVHPKCVCLHHGSHLMCPLLMASVVIEFDAAHLQANKRAVCKSPNSPFQYYWYFTGCIIKLDNPLWLEVKWWKSFQWPQSNHKPKAFSCLCISKASNDYQYATLPAEHENLSSDRCYTSRLVCVMMLLWHSVLYSLTINGPEQSTYIIKHHTLHSSTHIWQKKLLTASHI